MRTLTYLPGTMCDDRVWRPVWDELGGRFGVDYLPTHQQLSRAGIEGVIADAGEDRGPLHLAAFSMGGYFALSYALAAPGRVASLIVVCTSAFGLTDAEKAERLRAIAYLETHDYRGIPQSRIDSFVHPTRRLDPAVAGVMREMDRDLGKDILLAQLRETSARVSLGPRLGEIACPTLLIACDSDPYVSSDDLQHMHELMPHAQTELVANAGHMLPLEQPRWLAERIAAFHSGV